MASFLIGVVLFALGIALTIALHEAGHLIAARSCGMRVRQYFVGFGPRIFSFRRGHTEYGLRAIPFGGFCEIAGMTPNDPLTPDEEPRAMCRQGALKRIAVMLAGIAVNLVLGTVIIYLVAVLGQVPNPDADRSARVGETVCTTEGEDCTGPAEAAGVEPGDRIVALDSRRVATFPELQSRLARHEPGAEVALRVERGGQTLELPVTLAESSGGSAALGVVSAPIAEPVASYGPIEAVPATVKLVGQTMVATVDAVARLPETIPGVAAAIVGAERAPDSPMSVVGASRVGGELVEYRAWDAFSSCSRTSTSSSRCLTSSRCRPSTAGTSRSSSRSGSATGCAAPAALSRRARSTTGCSCRSPPRPRSYCSGWACSSSSRTSSTRCASCPRAGRTGCPEAVLGAGGVAPAV